METVTEVIQKRSSFDCLLYDILAPVKPEYKDAIGSARAYWNSLTLQRQRQIYWQLREDKRHGVAIKENPRFAIEDCHPVPNNWNGRSGINEMMKSERMVSAKYKASSKYGIYTLKEAKLFEMEDIKPLNFRIKN